ncbi:penicillin-binding transpeptidase domain-containing protein [Gymnodinialimonas hymeniacidonis]|uniref:penicillin-binding transpeptidase domain-containing protein n=1 Tax=Gymnodinialimonas hymeniacidonis TaxID=3126508 RepID=UPI0034C65804
MATDLATGQNWVLEDSDIDTRRAPYSTFKIPNLLIALETGVEASLDSTRAWDQSRRPALRWWPDTWQRDHSLRTAFRDSVVWYFRDIALEVGDATYRNLLSDWSYGNANVPDGSDDFWLTGALQISVAEQVGFLSALLRGDLGLSDAARIALVEAARTEQRGDVTLHGKTGGGFGYEGGGAEGWYVGFLTRTDAAPLAFALYLNGATWVSIRDARRVLSERLLQEAGFWPDS